MRHIHDAISKRDVPGEDVIILEAVLAHDEFLLSCTSERGEYLRVD